MANDGSSTKRKVDEGEAARDAPAAIVNARNIIETKDDVGREAELRRSFV